MNQILNKLEALHGIPKKILLLGTGGGSDIFSCLLIAKLIKGAYPNIKIDLAGMLSPASIHYFTGKAYDVREYPVNNLCPYIGKIRRTLDNPAKTEISFVDNKLGDAIISMGLRDTVYNAFYLSCRFGTKVLISEFGRLCKNNMYDYVLGVDVGGDILNKLECKTTLSPIMDWTALHVLKNAKTPSYIFEFGYGLDGEEIGWLKDNVATTESDFKKVAIAADNLWFAFTHDNYFAFPDAFNSFKKMYEDVMKPVRSGHTIPLFLELTRKVVQTIQEPCNEYKIPHTYVYRINGQEVLKDEFVRVGVQKPTFAWLIDPSTLIDKIPDGYDNPMELVFDLKVANPYIATELDGQTYRMDNGEYVLMAALSKRLDGSNIGERIYYLKLALTEMLEKGGYSAFVFFDEDMKELKEDVCGIFFNVMKRDKVVKGLAACTKNGEAIYVDADKVPNG